MKTKIIFLGLMLLLVRVQAQTVTARTNNFEIDLSDPNKKVNTSMPVINWVTPVAETSYVQDGKYKIKFGIESVTPLKNIVLSIKSTTQTEVRGNQNIQPKEEEKLNILGIATGDLLETIAYNIRRNDGPAFYQQEIYERVPASKLEEMREAIRRHCDQFAVKTDRMLYTQLGIDTNAAGSSTDRRAGVGIYYFEADLEEGQ